MQALLWCREECGVKGKRGQGHSKPLPPGKRAEQSEGGRLLAGLDKRLGVPGSPLGSLHGGDPRGESSTVMSPELEIRLRSGVRGQGSRSQIFCNPSSERSEVLRQRGPAGQPRLGTSGGGAFYSATHEDLHPVSGR
jgi:hypothetical protein